MIWLLLVNLLVLFVALRGICYAANLIEQVRNETIDIKATILLHEAVREACKKGDTK